MNRKELAEKYGVNKVDMTNIGILLQAITIGEMIAANRSSHSIYVLKNAV